MPTPPLSNELAQQAADLFKEHNGSFTAAARALGVDQATFRNRVKRAAERGLMGTKPVLPGFEIKQTATQKGADGTVEREWVQQRPERGPEFVLPEGQSIKGVSALVDGDGRTIQTWVKTRTDEPSVEHVVELLKTAFADFAPAATPVPAPEVASTDLLTLIPLADWHIGMFAWRGETGENWDLKIAAAELGSGVEDLIARTPASDEAIVLGGGDLLHSDNNENKTARSGNVLQVDGRYDKTVLTACRLVVRTTDAALRRHKRVTVRILKGNHDEHAAVAVAFFLLAWYRNEPRVTVDTDASLFFWHRHGSVLLGATHGHTVKIADMPQIMAHRRAEDWGVTRFRYVHGFHLHHSAKFATEGGGVISEIHQAPIPQDAWHFGAGFLSGRSLQAVTYHREHGEVGRVRVSMGKAA
jgi:transposase-like protein